MGQTVIPLQAAVTTATIAQSTSLSGAIDLGVQRLAAIHMPAAWDAAALSFQVSADGIAWADLYGHQSDTAYVIQAAPSRAIIVPFADFIGARYLKVRSGTSAAPVNQTAPRLLGLVLQ